MRCNAASNAQVIANNCRGIREVALYAEFGFEGAVIASNLVDRAATGIEVTNFNDGGRLAVVQGNLIRNLFRREHEPVDKRGTGIGIEADTIVTGNTIENAPTSGIAVGWGKWMRQVGVSSNLIRNATIGIAVSSLADLRSVLISANIIDGATDGAIRLMDHDRPVGEPLDVKRDDATALNLQGNIIS